MKNLIIIGLVIFALQSCQSGQEYKTFRTAVLTYHDQVMMDTEKAVASRMKLDTLSGQLDSLFRLKVISDTTKEKQQIQQLIIKLDGADEQMNDWMHKFNADIDGKSNEEASAYFKAEKQKIVLLDSLYKVTLKESAAYLSKFKR